MSSRETFIRIPFNRPPHFEGISSLLARAVEHGHTAGGGPFTKECETFLGKLLGVSTLLTTSCTHSLEMAALLLDIAPGDEVVIPSFTFVSTANAFALRGARIRFVDCDAYGNLSLDHVERMLTPTTRAVVPVHYAGNSCDMDRLLALCRERGPRIVEDAAQTIGSRFNGKPLGTFGDLGCLSFHETKNISSGEGGALLVGNRDFLTRALHLRDKGTNRQEFSLGMAEKYSWIDLGSSWALSDLNAAYLESQLARMNAIMSQRKLLWLRYAEALRTPVKRAGGRVLENPPHNTPNYHLFAIVWPDADIRGLFIRHMADRGILTPFHYVALHASPFGSRYAANPDEFPETDRLSNGLVRLPLFFNLTPPDQDDVIEAVIAFSKAGG
jgi:dTDP-4-amino-4,6-dideoxygalactose transaminase